MDCFARHARGRLGGERWVTSHLDMATREMRSDPLSEFEGTARLVS